MIKIKLFFCMFVKFQIYLYKKLIRYIYIYQLIIYHLFNGSHFYHRSLPHQYDKYCSSGDKQSM